MSRLSIEISPKQHQKIKAMAVVAGKSIKDLVLDKLFESDEGEHDEPMDQLLRLIDTRIENAEKGEISKKSIDDIVSETLESVK